MHARSTEAAVTAVRAIGPVDIGLVEPAGPDGRGRGFWFRRDIGPEDVASILPRAAAANVRGHAVYMRPRPTPAGEHRGIVLLDDLNAASVARLSVDGFKPRLVVETSPGNFQGWIALTAEVISDDVACAAARLLADRYGADPRAVAASQPGRLPGFTNRKPQYRSDRGLFPFVRIHSAQLGLVAPEGLALIASCREGVDHPAQAPRAARAPEKVLAMPTLDAKTTSHVQAALAAGANRMSVELPVPQDLNVQLEAFHRAESARIDAEVAAGRRPPNAASASERDFALAVRALREGVPINAIEAWLACRRPKKDGTYPARTLKAALTWVQEYQSTDCDAAQRSPSRSRGDFR